MAEVPAAVTTVTSTTPLPAGSVAVICVFELTEKLVAAVSPKDTAVAPVKPVPVRITLLPPASGPAAGLTTLATVGAAAAEKVRSSIARPLTGY